MKVSVNNVFLQIDEELQIVYLLHPSYLIYERFGI